VAGEVAVGAFVKTVTERATNPTFLVVSDLRIRPFAGQPAQNPALTSQSGIPPDPREVAPPCCGPSISLYPVPIEE